MAESVMCINMTAIIVIITMMIVGIIMDSQDIVTHKVLPTILDLRIVVVATTMAHKAVATAHHSESAPIIHQSSPRSRGIHRGSVPQAVLYSPPPVLVDSVRSLYRVRVESTRTAQTMLAIKKNAQSPCGLHADLLKFTIKKTIILKY
jgi:hypothetical protein